MAVNLKKLSGLVAASLVALPAGLLGTPVLAQDHTTVVLSPSCIEVGQGEAFSVEIAVVPHTAIAGMQFDLSFDPSVVVVVGVEEGDLLRQDGADTFFVAGTVDNGVGRVTGVAAAISSPGETVSSPGVFAVVAFEAAEAAGMSSLDPSNVIVGDAGACPLPVVVESGTVSVGQGAGLSGLTGEVTCDLLEGVTVSLLGEGSIVVASDESGGDGSYRLSIPETGDYEVLAAREGFRDRNSPLTVTDTGQVIELDFLGKRGLIPEDPAMSYVLACVNRWLYPPDEQCGLPMSTVLEVVNAWLYPL